MIRKTAIAAAIATAVASAAQAAPLVTNGSFEVLPESFVPGSKLYLVESGSDKLYGWSVAHGPLAVYTSTFNAPADGDWFVDLAAYISQIPRGAISQTIDTVAGQSYRLSFDLGDDTYGLPTRMNVSLGDFFSQDYALNDARYDTVPFVWKTYTVDFVAQSDSTLLTFAGIAAGGSDNIALDNVKMEALGVPEPSTWALLLAGFAGVGVAARARRRTAHAI